MYIKSKRNQFIIKAFTKLSICFRGKWGKIEEYLKGDLLYIDLEVDNSDEYAHNNNNNNRFQDTKRYWFG